MPSTAFSTARRNRVLLLLSTTFAPACFAPAMGQTVQLASSMPAALSKSGFDAVQSTGGADTVQATDATASEIRVTGKAIAGATGSREQARLAQKLAPNIVDVMPQSEIKDLPNLVIGDAVRRMPGASVINKSGEARSVQIRGIDPNLNGITYEGVLLPAGSINAAGRAVPLDAIPAALVGGMELIKTNAPDQDATALGGQLNLLSRDMGPDEQPYLEVQAADGFRQPHATNIYQGTVSGGIRFGLDSNPFDPNSTARKPFTLTFFATDTSDLLDMDDIQQTFADKSTLPSNALSKAQRVEYAQTKRRRGYGGTFGWDVDDNTKLYFKGFASGIDYHPKKYALNYAFSGQTVGATSPGTYDATTSMSDVVNDNLIHDDERLYKFGGVSTVGKVRLDYYGAYASNRLYSPYSYTGTLTGATGVPFYVDNVTTPLLPTMNPTNGTNINDNSAYKLTGLSNAYQDDRDAAWSGHVGASAPLDFGPVKGTLSAGGGVRLEKVTHDDLTYTYSNVPSLTSAQLGAIPGFSIFDDAYYVTAPSSAAAIDQLIRSGAATENSAADAITDQQAALRDNENIYSGYIQYSGQWGKLGILTGVRFEKTDGIYRGTSTSIVGGVTTLAPRTVRQNYSNFFPTVQLRYAFTDNLIGRANFSTAIGRPGFSQLTASQTVNVASATVTEGNPNLKPTTGDNYDVSLEYYMPFGGILSVGGFDKEFKNYIAASTVNGSFPGITGNVVYSTYANINHASARGFEVNYRQKFSFLPGLLSGLGVGGNFTYVDSHGAKRDGVSETLNYTTPRSFNVEAFYERGRVSLQLAGNYQSRTMTSLGSTPTLDNYVQPFLNFDVDARYKINERFSVFFQGRNVTNENQIATEGKSSTRYTEIQYFGSSYLFGVDLKI